ncbi:MAG: M81 family metallopeptidase [Acetobacteraceae bacterium]|nr:M81 family metallopeptidase [Acetobacteraceae bacterium]
MRIMIASVMHEANSFAGNFVPFVHFARRGVLHGADIPPAYVGTRTEMAAFMATGAEQGWEIVPTLVARGTPSGPIDAAGFARIIAMLAEATRAALPVDGVLLALHGAFSSEAEDDGDGAFAATVRAIVGPDVPISITLDPHGNVSDRLAASVNAISAYRTHPHTDHFEAGQRAATTLARALNGEIAPVVHLARAPLLRGFDACRTTPRDGPMQRAMAQARAMEAADPGVIEVSVQAGYSSADVFQAGASVAVTGDRRDARFDALAAQMVRLAWDERYNETVKMLTAAEAFAEARADPPGHGPIVIADFGDAPNAGGHGDTTALLGLILATKPPKALVAAIADRSAVEAARAAGVGGQISIALGGHVAPAQGGGPFAVVARVVSLADGIYVHEGPYTTGVTGDLGASALLDCGGVMVIVTTLARSIFDLAQIRIFGIQPEDFDLIAIKVMDAFRAGFAPIMRMAICCETGGTTSRFHVALTYTKLRRPIWPLDPDDVVARHAGYLP